MLYLVITAILFMIFGVIAVGVFAGAIGVYLPRYKEKPFVVALIVLVIAALGMLYFLS